MSLYALGGNAGFALGPILVTPFVLLLGLKGTLLLAVMPTIVALVLARDLGRLGTVAADKAAHTERRLGLTDPDPDDWPAFVRLGGVVSLRSCVYFGLQAFVPVWFIHHLGTSKGAGNAALTAMVLAGAAGTYFGGRVVDRLGRRRMVVGFSALLIPVLVAFVLAPTALSAGVLVALTGFVMIATFSITVVMSQEYLPSRLGLASGVSLGLAIGVGGMAAAGMGAIADAYGLRTIMWLIVALTVPMLALARTLPVTRADRRAQGEGATGGAAAPPAPAPGSASPRPSG
jgi:FSR family fosmidomycin resistance protein-like MFS transporter